MLRLVSFNMEWYWAWSAASCAGEEEGEKDAMLLPEPPTSPRIKVSECLLIPALRGALISSPSGE